MYLRYVFLNVSQVNSQMGDLFQIQFTIKLVLKNSLWNMITGGKEH